jgi:hypothetical protein
MTSIDGNSVDKVEKESLGNNGSDRRLNFLHLLTSVMHEMELEGLDSSQGQITKCKIGGVLRSQHSRLFPDKKALREFYATVLKSGAIIEFQNDNNEAAWKWTRRSLPPRKRLLGANPPCLKALTEQNRCSKQVKPMENPETKPRKRHCSSDGNSAARGKDNDQRDYASNARERSYYDSYYGIRSNVHYTAGAEAGNSYGYDSYYSARSEDDHVADRNDRDRREYESKARDYYYYYYYGNAGLRRDYDDERQRHRYYAHAYDRSDAVYNDYDCYGPPAYPARDNDSYTHSVRRDDEDYYSKARRNDSDFYSKTSRTDCSDEYRQRRKREYSEVRSNQNFDDNEGAKAANFGPRPSESANVHDPCSDDPNRSAARTNSEADENEHQPNCGSPRNATSDSCSVGVNSERKNGRFGPGCRSDDCENTVSKILLEEGHRAVNEGCSVEENNQASFIAPSGTTSSMVHGDFNPPQSFVNSGPLDPVLSPTMPHLVEHLAASATSSQSIQEDLQVLLEIMKELEQSGYRTESGGIPRSQIREILGAKYPNANQKRLGQFWTAAFISNKIVQSLTNKGVEYRIAASGEGNDLRTNDSSTRDDANGLAPCPTAPTEHGSAESAKDHETDLSIRDSDDDGGAGVAKGSRDPSEAANVRFPSCDAKRERTDADQYENRKNCDVLPIGNDCGDSKSVSFNSELRKGGMPGPESPSGGTKILLPVNETCCVEGSKKQSPFIASSDSPVNAVQCNSGPSDVIKSPLHHTALETAGLLTGNQPIQGDLQTLLQVMNDLEQSGCRTKSGGIRKSLVEVVLKAKYSNPLRIEQFWTIASQCGEVEQYLVGGEAEFRRVSPPSVHTAEIECNQIDNCLPGSDQEAVDASDGVCSKFKKLNRIQDGRKLVAPADLDSWVPTRLHEKDVKPASALSSLDGAMLAPDVALLLLVMAQLDQKGAKTSSGGFRHSQIRDFLLRHYPDRFSDESEFLLFWEKATGSDKVIVSRVGANIEVRPNGVNSHYSLATLDQHMKPSTQGIAIEAASPLGRPMASHVMSLKQPPVRDDSESMLQHQASETNLDREKIVSANHSSSLVKHDFGCIVSDSSKTVVERDVSLLASAMKDLEDKGVIPENGWVPKSRIADFLRNRFPGRFCDREELRTFWSNVRRSGKIFEYRVGTLIQVRFGESGSVSAHQHTESPIPSHQSEIRTPSNQAPRGTFIERCVGVPDETTGPYKSDPVTTEQAEFSTMKIGDGGAQFQPNEIRSPFGNVQGALKSESPALEMSLLNRVTSYRGGIDTWRSTEAALISQLDHELLRESRSRAPALCNRRKRVRFLDNIEIHSIDENLQVASPVVQPIPCSNPENTGDADMDADGTSAITETSYSGESFAAEWCLPELRRYILNRSKEMASATLTVRAELLHVNNPLNRRILDAYDQVLRSVSNARQMRKWQLFEIKVMMVDQMQLSKRAQLPGGPNGLELKIRTQPLVPGSCPTVHTAVVPIKSTTINYDCEGSPFYFNPNLVPPGPVHVQFRNVLIGKADKAIDFGALELNLGEMASLSDVALEASWYSFVKELPVNQFVKRARVTFAVRQVRVPFDDFDSRRRYDLIQLHNGLQQILELNEFLSRQGYSAALHFPIDWAADKEWTLLHGAVHLACHRLAETLMKRGASPSARTPENPVGSVGSPLDLARENLAIAENGKFDSNFANVNIERLRKIVQVLENHGK